ncbi:AMP-binding protein [Persephonella sp.]
MIEINKNARLITGEKIIDHSEINRHITAYSKELNIKKGDRVCIYSENRPEWIYSFFSVWKKGGIPVPIDFMSVEDEISYILEDSEPSYIFCSQEKFPTLEKSLKILGRNIPVLIFEDLKINSHAETDKKDQISTSEEDTAVILYTSGTTGPPKGVMLSYKNLLSNINSIHETKIADSSDKTIAILPFHHSYPLMVSMLVPLTLGATIIFLEKLSSEEILSLMKKHKVSILVGVPRLYTLFHRKIFEKINSNLIAKILFNITKKINNQHLSRYIFGKVHKTFGGNIKYFVSGGAKLDEDVARDLWALGFKIVEGYGLTETSPIVSFNPPDKIKLGSVGKPIKGVQVKIEDGEIIVKGDNVMKGYYKKPEKTAEVIKNGWLYTGDLGYLDPEGYLFVTGRKKDIIVLPSGKNINPEEIESKILKISDLIREVAVVMKDGQLFAVIYPDFQKVHQSRILNLEETIKWNVIDKYNLSVPDYKRIYSFKIVRKELPKTRLGKIKRFLLEDFLKEEKTLRKDIKDPDLEEYKILKDYLKKVSKREVYPDSHIELDLGLDSLEKVELQAFIEQTFGVEITDEQLADLPTVEELSRFISEKKKKIELEEINWKKLFEKDIKIDIKDTRHPIIILKKMIKPVFKVYFSLEINGLDNLPDRNFILAPNHQSLLDGFLIVVSLPNKHLENTYFLAEEIYFESYIRKIIARNFHVLTVNINKDLKLSLQKTAMLLKKNKNVVIFPEGARTRDGGLLPFKKSFAILSKELNVPVIPVAIKGAYEAFPIGSKFPKPHKITVTFLKPVYPEGKTEDQIIKETYQKILKNI